MFIKARRQQNQLSQEQLAESSGLGLRTIQRVESGNRVNYASLMSRETICSSPKLTQRDTK